LTGRLLGGEGGWVLLNGGGNKLGARLVRKEFELKMCSDRNVFEICGLEYVCEITCMELRVDRLGMLSVDFLTFTAGKTFAPALYRSCR
jgi:hypothetical protein